MYFSDRFIGRHGDLAAITELFAAGERLVTVTGPPGIGKTRLAYEYASGITASKRAFCDVAEARTRETFFARVAELLGLPPIEVDGSAEKRIGRELAKRGLELLVLDGFEYLVPAVASTLAGWLRESPGMSFLVTSRELLRMREEVTYELSPLALSERASEPSDAVQLLLERIQRRRRSGDRPSDTLSAEEYASAKHIVAHLDGIPLAIELAAARVRTLGMKVVADRLAIGLDLLADGARDPHASRQHTLRAALAWSWNLLVPAEQTVLAQCSVFQDGFSVDAAEAIVTVPSGSSARVLDCLQALREKSLVRALPLTGGGSRFELYSSIRHYAAERLVELDPASTTALRHARHYLRALDDPHDHGNVDAAIRRMTTHPARTTDDLALAYDAVVAYAPAVLARGDLDAYLVLLDLVLELGDEVAPAKRAAALNARGDIRRMRGLFAGASSDLDGALALAHPADDERLRGRVMRNLGALALSQGELVRARACCEEALTLHRRTGDRELEGVTLADLGAVDRGQGLLDTANQRLERALELLRDVGDQRYELVVLGSLGLVQLDLGETRRARAHLERAVELCRDMNSELFGAYTRSGLAMIDHQEGELDSAVALYEPSIATIRASGSRRLESACLGYCGVALFELRRFDAAIAMLRHAERIAHEVGDRLHECLFAGYTAMVLASRGELAAAAAALDRATPVPECVRAVESHHIARLRVELESSRSAAAIKQQYLQYAATTHRSFDVQLSGRLLERALQDAPSPSVEPRLERVAPADELIVDARGRWFRFEGRKIVCHKRPVVRRLLMQLVEERLRAPGRPVSVDVLKRAGWPDENIAVDSANLRLRVSLTSLRKLGLRDLLRTEHGGYLLDASVPVRIADDDGELRTGIDPRT